MRNRLWLLCAVAGTLFLFAPAHAETPTHEVRTNVESCFDRLIEARMSVPQATESYNQGIFVSNDIAGLKADLSRLAPAAELMKMASRPEYRAALLSELRSPKPAYRGLACEALGVSFEIDAVPQLGTLLDDSSLSAPVVDYRTPQRGPDNPVWFTPSVSQAARKSLLSLISINFPSRKAFDTWWKTNSRYEDKLWYWAAKWSAEWRESHQWHRSASASESTGDLSSLPKETALKILLLVPNQWALEAELKSAAGSSAGISPRFFYPTELGPSPDAAAKFVKDRHLGPNLIALLRQERLYPEIASQEAFDGLVSRMAEIARGVFGPADEPAIAAAQQISSPFKPPLPSFAFIRAAAAPDRERQILSDALRSDPTLTEVCRSLISVSGSAEAEAIKECFRRASGYQQVYICDSIRQAAGKQKPVDKVFLADLVQMLTFDEQDTSFSSAECLGNLAEAARTVVGTDAISEDDVRSVAPVRMKAGVEELRQANAGLGDRFDALKAKLLAVLDAGL